MKVWVRVGPWRLFGPVIALSVLWLGLAAMGGYFWQSLIVWGTIVSLWLSHRDIQEGRKG